jgi:hypothetical protein
VAIRKGVAFVIPYEKSQCGNHPREMDESRRHQNSVEVFRASVRSRANPKGEGGEGEALLCATPALWFSLSPRLALRRTQGTQP